MLQKRKEDGNIKTLNIVIGGNKDIFNSGRPWAGVQKIIFTYIFNFW